ncbi:MAG: hypothetical protein LBQ24_06605 [Candidatus Peribacteria bacterium]|nr:hypothetical protein [Candidatus Peribacteria bacterium]
MGSPIFLENQFFTKSSISFSKSALKSFINSSFTTSNTVIRYGIKSTFTSCQKLYLQAL